MNIDHIGLGEDRKKIAYADRDVLKKFFGVLKDYIDKPHKLKGVKMRYFNTAGPVRCDEHYCLPPLERFDLEEILLLIEQKKYFVLHAPRQTGKTSCLLALQDRKSVV